MKLELSLFLTTTIAQNLVTPQKERAARLIDRYLVAFEILGIKPEISFLPAQPLSVTQTGILGCARGVHFLCLTYRGVCII